MISELDQVVLAEDIPEKGLQAGDIGTIVLVHQGGKGYEVEFTAMDGSTVAVVTLHSKQVGVIRHGQIAHVRDLVAV